MVNDFMNNNPFLPQTEIDRKKMLKELSKTSVEDLFEDIPSNVIMERDLNLPEPLSEMELEKHIDELAVKNKSCKEYISFLGGGVYDHYVPSVVKHVLNRSEFYTSYTPYQAEISQGTLQSMFEYQTMIANLTGMEIANASIYDGATATAEAAIKSIAISRKNEIIVSSTLNPSYREVLKTYLEGQGFTLKTLPHKKGMSDLSELAQMVTADTACVILQSPNYFGILEDFAPVKDALNKSKALFVVVTDPISLALIEPPASWGADIVVGDGQSFGNPMNFGGPLLGFFAAKEKNIRKMPGRMSGETIDKDGNMGFVMTLQTREQHIRREKATSNICSNQALNVIAACVYLSIMGPKGLKEVANHSMQKAHYASKQLEELDGVKLKFEDRPFFKEFLLELPGPVESIQEALLEKGIFAGIDVGKYYQDLENCLLLSFTEKRSKGEIDYLVKSLGEVL